MIFVILDHYSKMVHFTMRLHGLSKLIVSDRDAKFTSYFLKTLWHKTETLLKFSTIFQPQTDGQTEVVNHSLKILLRCLVKEHPRLWDCILPTVEFAYNNSVNRYKTPFEIVHGYKPRSPIDFLRT